MNVFKSDPFYRWMMAGIFIGCLTLVMLAVQSGTSRVEVFLFGTVAFIAFCFTIYFWAVRVRGADGNLCKRLLFSRKCIRLEDVGEISVMSLKGRYIFLLITRDRFLILSSLLANFGELLETIREGVPEKARADIEKITPKELESKSRVMKLIMLVILIVVFAATSYMEFVKYRL